MGHCRLLFVGGRDNLDKIFAACPDSSSETAAEMTIGADWVDDYDWLTEEEKKLERTTDNFTKENTKLYDQVIRGCFFSCYDIRNINHYGEFACINCPDYEPYDGNYIPGREERNFERTLQALKQLPDDTLFHFADSHW